MFTSLLHAELLRARHRPRVWITLLAIFLVFLVVPMNYIHWIMPISPEERQEAYESWRVFQEQCPECGDSLESFLPMRFSLAEAVEYHVMGWTIFLGVLAFVANALYVTSDFRSGALGTQLTFTPRREAVLAARTLISTLLGGLFAGAGVIAMVSVTFVWYIVGHGFAAVEDAQPLFAVIVGTVVLGAIAGAVGCLLAFMGVTRVALGLGLVLMFFVFSGIAAALGDSLLVMQLIPDQNAVALIRGHALLPLWGEDGEYGVERYYTITRQQAVAYFGSLLLVLTVAAWLIFRRRDIRG